MSSTARTPAQRRPGQNSPTPRQILVRRAIALGTVAVVLAIAVALVAGSMGSSAGSASVKTFAEAWAAGNEKAMYEQLTPEIQGRYSLKQFTRLSKRARDTATVRKITVDRVREVGGDRWEIDSHIATSAFGTITTPLRVPVSGSGENALIKWDPSLIFPGMPSGSNKLSRTTSMPARADLLARDGTVLARGADRTSSIPDIAAEVKGVLGPIPEGRKNFFYSRGYPSETQVGVSGLESSLEVQLAGRPGGTLKAAGKTLARTEPKQAGGIRSTIDIDIERSAIASVAERGNAAVVAIRPRTGEILAFSGSAFRLLQPPGSTFKIITLAGALEAGIAHPNDTFESVQSVQLSGVDFENADKEFCGGTLTIAFAKSCNSVFGPLGAKLGAKKLTDIANRFGYDKKPDILGAATSVMPTSDKLSDDLAVGSAAIGQNTTQSTALQMGVVAATIALGGARPKLTLDGANAGRRAKLTRVISREIAREVERMMLVTVSSQGTGIKAQIPGVKVAGKTGTAELKNTQIDCNPNLPFAPAATATTSTTATTPTTTPTDPDDRPCPEPTDDDTTAWFTSYAPAGNPQIAVAVMIPGGGQGRDSAAPAAKVVMETALKKK